MPNDKKLRPDPKKGFPGSFFILLIATVLIILTVQSLSSGRMAKVSFSHQLEHLVNLNFLDTDENRKISLNENLVTFSGKFKNQLEEDSINKFRYLEMLNENGQLKFEKQRLETELIDLQTQVETSADYFLQISGMDLSKTGYVVVSSMYNFPDFKGSIVIDEMGHQPVNLEALKKNYYSLRGEKNSEKINQFGLDLNQLIKMFRSSTLGIGSSSIKDQLNNLEAQVEGVQVGNLAQDEKLSIYGSALSSLEQITAHLNESKNGVRLFDLRSVRNYLDSMEMFQGTNEKLEKNSALLSKTRDKVAGVIWFFNNKELSTRSLEKQDPEVFHHWFLQVKQEWENFNTNKGLVFKAPDQPSNLVLEKTFKSQEQSPNYFSYILTILPIVILVLILYFIFSRQMKGMGSGAMNFGKSPARLMTKDMNKITFKDVAGAEEAKEELQEIVEFLKDPQRFTSLGARIPKGVLLVGPPGTGKTLVAKAVAGEADRPFFSISGSDFVEMFVGVGASRIRDMFEQAKKNAPCINFMDEIDAVGRHRGAGIGGGHDEREQTLNQLLVEMDGFDTKEGVILMAATNRPDILDRALLRPGRFDRRVSLDLPDVKGRFEILKVHARKIKIDESVNLMEIAKITPGASGADLENILNESALIAARHERKAVTSVETREACDKVRFGKERRSLEMDEFEKKTTAFHEAGHAIVALKVERSDPVDKVTIIPRGFSLGATHFMPKKNRLGFWKKEAIDQLAILMGGRAAEEIFVKDMSSGAKHDFMQATRLSRSMVCEWGMSESLGLASYEEQSESGQYLGMSGSHERKYSEKTAREIDEEVSKMLETAHKAALKIVEENKDKAQLMADMLMEFETLDAQDVKEIMEDKWDPEKKRSRIKKADELHKKAPPPPPPEEKDEVFPENSEPNIS